MDLSLIDQLSSNTNVHLLYVGTLSQDLISDMIQLLEKEAEASNLGMTDATNLFTVFIELSQNIVNYTHLKEDGTCRAGLVLVERDRETLDFFIQSQNIICAEDRQSIEPKLQEIKLMDKESIKKRYRELRKSGANAHDKGAGIGFYEIAKRCDDIDYQFLPLPDNLVSFRFKAHIAIKKS
jgi:hypothetical protein